MPKYHVKWSGWAEVEADSKDDAIKQAKSLAAVCATFVPLEVGVDVDSLGYEIRKDK